MRSFLEKPVQEQQHLCETFLDKIWQRPAGLGKPKLRRFIVSSRHLYERGWPVGDQAGISEARRKYDNGTHELATGREGNFLVLYCIPRRRPVPPRTYFSSMFEIVQ